MMLFLLLDANGCCILDMSLLGMLFGSGIISLLASGFRQILQRLEVVIIIDYD